MAGYLGNSAFSNVYLGSLPVDSLYLGADKFWPEAVEDEYRVYFENHQFTIAQLESAFSGIDIIGYNTGSTFTEVTSSTTASWDGYLGGNITKILDYDGMITSLSAYQLSNYFIFETASLHGLVSTNGIIASSLYTGPELEMLFDFPVLPAFTNFGGWMGLETVLNVNIVAPSASLIDDWFCGDPSGFFAPLQTTLNTFDFPEVITVGANIMNYASNFGNQQNSPFTTINLPKCETIGQNAFITSAPNVTTINVPSLVAPNGLGGSPGDNQALQSITATGGTITIPVDFMTNNAGNPDGDLQRLINQSWTVNYSDAFTVGGKELTKEFISSSFGITDFTDFYDTSSGDTILKLSGSYSIVDSAFESDNGVNGISSFIDGANGYCTELGYRAFAFCYPNFVSASFPEVTTIGEQCFFTSFNLASVHIPKLTSVPDNAFNNCTSLRGDTEFLEATSVGFRGFFNTRLETINLPKVESVSSEAFGSMSELTTIDLSSLIAPNGLGGSPANNNVFGGSIPNSGSITLPTEFATNNAGNPDGDLQILIDKGWTINYI